MGTKEMTNDREREALMRLTMCARHECKMCIFQGFDSEVCYRIATDCMHILADALNADRKTENSSEKPNNSKERLQACIDCEHTDMCEWCYTRWSKDEPERERSSE